jgi:AraC-like DNA-binding protein
VRSPALPETCYPSRLWLWPGHAVYVGPSLGLDPHSGSVSCLAVALDGTFTVETDGAPGPEVSSALIPPRLTHRVVAHAQQMAFCYLDVGSVRHHACRRAMTTTDGEIAYRHRHEHALATAGNLDDAGSARAWLDLTAGPPPVDHDGPVAHEAGNGRVNPAEGDPRIRDAIAILHDLDPHTAITAAHLAAAVGMSQSRFLHLFRDHTGTTFRRYRLWLRMLRAAELIRDRADLTTAATGAGFSSPSHFSDSFHTMFGLRPSQLLGSEIRLA